MSIDVKLIAELGPLSRRIIALQDATCEQARTIFYGGIDRQPGAIVRVADASDVSRLITFARESGFELAVRSGGHSALGHGLSDGGIVLDLKDMRSLDIDVAGRTAWAEAGLTAVEYTQSAGAHDLATGFGDTGSVGIGAYPGRQVLPRPQTRPDDRQLAGRRSRNGGWQACPGGQ
jgi:FAD/FMN-containing dehydrogenase